MFTITCTWVAINKTHKLLIVPTLYKSALTVEGLNERSEVRMITFKPIIMKIALFKTITI